MSFNEKSLYIFSETDSVLYKFITLMAATTLHNVILPSGFEFQISLAFI